MGYDAVVLGAGVLGLSSAVELSNKGFKVAIVAKDLPTDIHSVGFASPWAGCNWMSFETDGTCEAAAWDRATFLRLAELATDHPELCERIPFIDVCSYKRDIPWYSELVGGVSRMSDSWVPGGLPHGLKYSSYVINAPQYLAHLHRSLEALGVPFVRARLTRLDEAFRIPGIGPVKLVVNATGLGARSLVGVQDDQVLGARGQTVLVRAPGVKRCIVRTEGFNAVPKPGETLPPPAYIIPRPGTDHVVLGGVYQKHEYDPQPSLREAERIIRDCYALEPALAGLKDASDAEGWKRIEVVSHNVGIRPAREGGARVELERRKEGGVVHAYGIGGAGYQSSLGIAERVTELVNEYLGGAGVERARL